MTDQHNFSLILSLITPLRRLSRVCDYRLLRRLDVARSIRAAMSVENVIFSMLRSQASSWNRMCFCGMISPQPGCLQVTNKHGHCAPAMHPRHVRVHRKLAGRCAPAKTYALVVGSLELCGEGLAAAQPAVHLSLAALELHVLLQLVELNLHVHVRMHARHK